MPARREARPPGSWKSIQWSVLSGDWAVAAAAFASAVAFGFSALARAASWAGASGFFRSASFGSR